MIAPTPTFAPTTHPTPLDLRIEALAVAADVYGLRGESLVDYVLAHCHDSFREHVGARVDVMIGAGRVS